MLLSLAFFSVEAVDVAMAPPPLSYELKILSPANATYSPSQLMLNVSMTALVASNINRTMTYSLDSKEPVVVPLEIDYGDMPVIATLAGFTALPELSEGSHSITVSIETQISGQSPLWDNGTALFLVDDGFSPIISLLSVENKTYSTANIPLTYSVNNQVVNASYSLDGRESVPLSGNSTLTDLPEGSHAITVYASDGTGNEVSETAYFTVSPLPVVSILALVVVAIVGVGLFVFFKKRSRLNSA